MKKLTDEEYMTVGAECGRGGSSTVLRDALRKLFQNYQEHEQELAEHDAALEARNARRVERIEEIEEVMHRAALDQPRAIALDYAHRHAPEPSVIAGGTRTVSPCGTKCACDYDEPGCGGWMP